MSLSRAERFLADAGFAVTTRDLREVAASFGAEADARERGGPSSLLLLDSGIPATPSPATERPVVVIDAGGTNLRVAVADVSDAGVSFRHVRRSPMPGTSGVAVSADAFHRAIAVEADAAFAAEPRTDRLGYCFSYACRSAPGLDAELVAWSKQVDAPEVVGQRVGAELTRRLARRPSATVVLNDTVATWLALRAVARGRPSSGALGLILGTGTNVACVAGGTVRNAETGEFDKLRRSRFDEELDAASPDAGAGVFEKMIAGGYLGALGLRVLRGAADMGLFPSSRGLGALWSRPSLGTRELDAFAAGRADAASPLVEAFGAGDLPVARELARAVFVRSARLTAAHLAAFLARTAPADAAAPVWVAVDGSTYWKTAAVDFDGTVRGELAAWPGLPRCETVRIAEASLVGAAVAAATVPGRARPSSTGRSAP